MRRIWLSIALLAGLGIASAADNPVADFKKAYDGKDEASRLAAVDEIAKVHSRAVVHALAAPAAKDASANVRRAAIKALGGQWASSLAASALAKALHPDDDPSEVTLQIVGALGETQSDAAVAPLLGLLKHQPPQRGQPLPKDNVTIAALAALAKCGSAQATGDLIGFVLDEEPGAGLKARRRAQAAADPSLKHAIATLIAITGESRQTPEEWRDWWAENRGSLKVVSVLRCEQTGKTYDKPSGKAPCPHCGAAPSSCSSPLKTRYERVPLQAPK